MSALLLRRAVVAGAAVDVLVRDGAVASVVPAGRGDRADRVLPVPPPAGAEVVDADGAVLLPGLVDHHVHLAQWAATRHRVPLAGTTGPAAAAAALAAAPGDGLVVGHGFVDALWSEPPHRDALDAALPHRPAAAVSHDLHTAWVNTAAAARLGVTAPDGVLREDAAMRLLGALDADAADALDGWVLEAAAAAAARGTTAVVDLEDADPAAWARRGEPALRVAAGVWPRWADGVRAAGLRTGDPVPGAGPRVRLGPAKLFVDGSLGTRTAWCDDAYPGGGHGVARHAPGELAALLRGCARDGWRVAVHAIGDAAVAAALDAFAAAAADGARGSVEHAQQVRPADLPRFGALGVAASVQPRHAVDDRDVADAHWAGAADRSYPLAALHAAGARLLLGSDAPVAPLDPWDAVAAAVHRGADGDDRPPWHPEQQLPLDVALRAASARAGVAAGDPADLVLVADEPAAVLARGGAAALRATEVLATLCGGAWTHRRGL